MNNIPIQSAETADTLLTALGEQIRRQGFSFEILVVGGSALLALGLIARPTRDIDLVGVRVADAVHSAQPLPEPLAQARDRVARDFGLPADWLNAGAADLVHLGLPSGFVERAERRSYGPGLTVLFASRVDQIHLKLYATADQGPGKHEQDLRRLTPTRNELIEAARWSRTHDPSDGYLHQLRLVLEALGVSDADLSV
jgi:hypothetical protein